VLKFNSDTKVYLYSDSVSYRFGIRGLTSVITSSFDLNELKNAIFVFFNRAANSFKIIEFDDTGIFMYQYRLNKGKFVKPMITDDKVLININDLIAISKAIKVNRDQPLKTEPSL